MRLVLVCLMLLLGLPQSATAARIVVGNGSGFPSQTIVVQVSLVGDGLTAAFQADVVYEEPILDTAVLLPLNGATCVRPATGIARVVAFSVNPLPTQSYCQLSITPPAATPPGEYLLRLVNIDCVDGTGSPTLCQTTQGTLTVFPPAVAPTVTYTPPPGSLITFPGGGNVGSAVSMPIQVSASGGNFLGSVSIGNYNITGNGLSLIDASPLNFPGGTNSSENLSLRCVLGAVASSGTLQLLETRSPGGSNLRGWNLFCPAGTPVSTDLVVALTDTPDPVTAGTSFSYTATATNNGFIAAQDVSISLTLPEGISFVSAAPSAGGSCNGVSTVSCMWSGATAPSGVRSVTAVAAVPAAQTAALSATATAGSATPDPLPSNNMVTIPTTVQVSANLSILLTGPANSVVAGDPLTYTAVVTNSGPSVATGVTTSMQVPANTSFQSGNVSGGGTCSGSPVSCTITDGIAPLGTRTVTLFMVVMPSAPPGTLMATITASASSPDPTLPNTSSTTSTVTTSANLAISTVGSTTSVATDAAATFAGSSSNAGPSNAQNLRVTIELSGSFRYASHVAAGAACTVPAVGATGPITCTWNGATAPGVARSVSVSASSSAAGSSAISISTISPTFDPNTGNNSAQVTVNVFVPPPTANLSIPVTTIASCDPKLNVVSSTPVSWSSTNASYCLATEVDPLRTNWSQISCTGEFGCPDLMDLRKLRPNQANELLVIRADNAGTTATLRLTCYAGVGGAFAVSERQLMLVTGSTTECPLNMSYTPSPAVTTPAALPGGGFQLQSQVDNPLAVPLSATMLQQGQYGDATVEVVGNAVVIRYYPRDGESARASVVNESLQVVVSSGATGVPVTYNFQVDLALFSDGFEVEGAANMQF